MSTASTPILNPTNPSNSKEVIPHSTISSENVAQQASIIPDEAHAHPLAQLSPLKKNILLLCFSGKSCVSIFSDYVDHR